MSGTDSEERSFDYRSEMVPLAPTFYRWRIFMLNKMNLIYVKENELVI